MRRRLCGRRRRTAPSSFAVKFPKSRAAALSSGLSGASIPASRSASPAHKTPHRPWLSMLPTTASHSGWPACFNRTGCWLRLSRRFSLASIIMRVWVRKLHMLKDNEAARRHGAGGMRTEKRVEHLGLPVLAVGQQQPVPLPRLEPGCLVARRHLSPEPHPCARV